MHQVTIEEAKIQLPELIEAAVKGEDVFITKEDQ
jgi:prevent-host-death family protein